MKPLVFKKSRRDGERREPERHKLHIAKGDTVRVISGEHRGKEGKVLHVYPKEFRVVVEGVNIVKKHKRAATPNERRFRFAARAAGCKIRGKSEHPFPVWAGDAKFGSSRSFAAG